MTHDGDTTQRMRLVANGRPGSGVLTWKQIITILTILGPLATLGSWVQAEIFVPKALREVRKERMEDFARHGEHPHKGAARREDVDRLERGQERLVKKMDELLQELIRQRK